MEIDQSYSCKRKKDFVTLLGVLLFVSVICFELYLVLWVPVQLKARGVLEKDVARQEMIGLADGLRGRVSGLKPEGRLHENEVELVKECLDMLASYIRANQDAMSKDMVLDMSATLKKFERLVNSWGEKKTYFIAEERLGPEMLVRKLEEKAGLHKAVSGN